MLGLALVDPAVVVAADLVMAGGNRISTEYEAATGEVWKAAKASASELRALRQGVY